MAPLKNYISLKTDFCMDWLVAYFVSAAESHPQKIR